MAKKRFEQTDLKVIAAEESALDRYERGLQATCDSVLDGTIANLACRGLVRPGRRSRWGLTLTGVMALGMARVLRAERAA